MSFKENYGLKSETFENLSLILATDANGGIGIDGGLPWKRLEGDLPRFEYLTRGTTLIMGRKTFNSLPGLLPGRMHYVISSNSWSLNETYKDNCGVKFFPDVASVLRLVAETPHKKYFAIGGVDIFNYLHAPADKIYLTLVDAELPVDRKVLFVDRKGLMGTAFRKIASRRVVPFKGHSYSVFTYLNRRSRNNTFLRRLFFRLWINRIDRRFTRKISTSFLCASKSK